MDQERIGKFIAEARKSKNLTQEKLAEKLGITKNAVSKWERGLSIPDVSLFKKLCEELNISLEELINGEKDNSDKAKEKALISTLKEKNKIKKKGKKIIIALTIVFLIIISILIYYSKNLKVNLVTDSDYLYDVSLDYLKNEELENNPDSTQKDFNVFYSYHGFGIEKKDNYRFVYMWIYSTSYYIEGQDSLAISSSSSMPCKVTFKDNKLTKVEYPQDGKYYKSSIKEMFPSIIATQVLNFDKEDNINKLFNDVSNKKSIYYDYLTLDMNNLSLEDISYNDLVFSINIGDKKCIPVQLNIYKDNKYILYTAYKECKPKVLCTMMLEYTKSIEGNYDYDIMQIIKHSSDANNKQFSMDNLPKYEIFSGKGHNFVTDDDNKYLKEFLNSINVDLTKCAEADYVY